MSEAPARSTRQWLSDRQSATVDALLQAGLATIRDVGYEAMSLREVATRAGVTHTTAYTYFTSKDHLIAELSWRRLQAIADVEPQAAASLADRLADALRGPSELYSGEPALAEGVLHAMLARDPDTRRLRDRMGLELARRIAHAIGPDADRQVVDGVLLLYSGAMLEAGLGYSTYDQVVERIQAIVARWDPSRPA